MQSPRPVRAALPALAALGAILLSAPAASASVARHDPRHGFGHGTSTNWSGYAVDGTNATDAIGSWTVPAVTCAPGENSWSSPWVGIDGDISNTVEQTGTDSDCVNGTPQYYAWYEMYPKNAVLIPMTVRPGDSITASVHYTGSAFVLTLTDNTTRAPFSITQVSKKARRTSVEWIMEGPAGGLLSDFGTVAFGGDSATISGQTAALGSLSGAQPITMIDNQGATRALPSPVSGGSSFSVQWQHS